jgi:hypothetical protein
MDHMGLCWALLYFGFLSIEELLADSPHSLDLFPHSHGRSFGRNTLSCWYKCHWPNQLSGAHPRSASAFASSLYTRVLNCHDIKVWISFMAVRIPSYAFRSRGRNTSPPHYYNFLDLHLHISGRGFVVDCPSHVRHHPQYRATTIFQYQVLTEDVSIAIWNGNKVIKVVAISTWGINIASLIQGKSLPSPLLRMIYSPI